MALMNLKPLQKQKTLAPPPFAPTGTPSLPTMPAMPKGLLKNIPKPSQSTEVQKPNLFKRLTGK